MNTSIEPGIYKHYKGGLYQVQGIAYQEADHLPVVVYKPLYDIPELGGRPWFTRPLTEFTEELHPGQFRFVKEELNNG